MPIAHVNDVDLAYEEHGEGLAAAGELLLAPLPRHCLHARGYPPSTVPADVAAYSQDHAVEDLYGLLTHLGIEQAHVGGLSMGGSCTLHFGIRHPGMARSLIIAAAGSGSEDPEGFRQTCRALADRLEREGGAGFADYGAGTSRLQLKRKDPQALQGLLLTCSPATLLRFRQHNAWGSSRPSADLRLGERDGGHSYPHPDPLRR